MEPRTLFPHTLLAVLALWPTLAHDTGAQEEPVRPSVLDSYDFSGPADTVWELPRRLREISGLAFSINGRLLAHDDELAIVYEFDYVSGEFTKAFALGDTTARGDFEGIAATSEHVYLVTSDGRIHESAEGNDGDRLLYNVYGTGVGRSCEVEGLTLDHDRQHLIMACKSPRVDRLRDRVTFYRWSPETRTMAADSMLSIPLSRFTARMKDEDAFSPSGISRHPNGNYLVIAARESAIAEITRSGEVVSLHEFRRGAHRQLEGIEIATDGTVFLADEGGGRRARISVYRSRSAQ